MLNEFMKAYEESVKHMQKGMAEIIKKEIIDPKLIENGIDPKEVKIVFE